MQQPQNSSQDASSHSGQSQLSPAFAINHKNPYDQPEQTESPPSRYMSLYQPSSGTSGRSSLLTVTDAAQKVDQQLSRRWYACYRYWLYLMIIIQGSFFSTGFGFLIIFALFYSHVSLFYTVDTIQSAVELLYVITMIKILKYKQYEKIKLSWNLAVADIILMIVEVGVGFFGQKSFWRTHEGSSVFFIDYLHSFDLIIGPFLALSVIFPAWKIKCLVEKREAILQPKEDLYSLPM